MVEILDRPDLATAAISRVVGKPLYDKDASEISTFIPPNRILDLPSLKELRASTPATIT